MAVNLLPSKKPNTTIYSQFRGIHLTDPYLCDINHSPYALNLISNNEGLPEIRPGWRVVQTPVSPLTAKVHSIKKGNVGGQNVFLAHVGTKLFKWADTTKEEIYNGLSDNGSVIFFAIHQNKTKAWILTENQYVVYDGSTVQAVENIATIPVALIAKKPSGGGTPLDPINLLQPKRTEYFQGDGTSKVYQLAATGLDTDTIYVIEVTASGTKTRTDVAANKTTGQVTFATAPSTPPITGTDNIYITYSKTVTGYADRIKKCTIQTEYGETGSGRIFLSGNAEYKNYDYWSQLNDPTYFPDLNYGVLGNSNTAIMGYSRIGRYQAIVKEDNQQDATIFLRYASTDASGKTYFRVEAGISGTGAISKGSFISLVDEPLFLARTGLYAIVSDNVTAEKTLQNRSYYVNEVLSNEKNPENAIAVEWDGYYILSLNKKVYAFDSKSKEAHGTSFVYNCFLWNNINATCFMENKGELYFGTDTGLICKFNTDMTTNIEKYNDNQEAINVVWSTKLDNDGIPHMVKTMQKKGSGITTKPFNRSTYEIYTVTEKTELETLIKSFNRDIFDLNDVDLNRFSLESSPYAKFTPFKKKVKKYESLQIVVKGSATGEGFGIYNIVKQYIPVNYVKR